MNIYFQTDANSVATITKVEDFCKRIPHSLLNEMLNKLKFIGNSFDSLDIPLVHPLKQKGESLRPLTTLGQFGTIALVQELMIIYEEQRKDLIFTEMTNLTMDFQNHFNISKPDLLAEAPRTSNRALDMDENELCQILEKTHTSVPLAPPDDKSGSYHSFSDESDVIIPQRNHVCTMYMQLLFI